MTTLTPSLTSDDLRARVVQQLHACSVPARAFDLLADVERMLYATHISAAQQTAFWTGLSQDLDLLIQQTTQLDFASEATPAPYAGAQPSTPVTLALKRTPKLTRPSPAQRIPTLELVTPLGSFGAGH